MTMPMVILSALAIGAVAAAFWAMFREFQVRRENERTAEWAARMLGVQSQTQRALGREHFEEWADTRDDDSRSAAQPGSATARSLLDRMERGSASQ